jgi:hypothetical protein
MGTIGVGLSTPQGGAITVPPGVLINRVGTLAPRAPVGLYLANPLYYQLRTTIDYAWPDATATFAPGGGPGIPGTVVVLTGPGGGAIAYTAGTKSFGGAAAFAMTPGPFAGFPPFPVATNGQGGRPVSTLWMNLFKQAPASAIKAVMLAASNPAGVGAPGLSPSAPVLTTMFGPVPNAVRIFTGMLPILGPNGTMPPVTTGIAPRW